MEEESSSDDILAAPRGELVLNCNMEMTGKDAFKKRLPL